MRSDGFPFGRFYGRKHAWKPERNFPVCEIIIARHNCAVKRLRVRHGAPLHYNFLDYKIMADRLHKKDGEKGYYKRAILSSWFGQLFDDYVFVFLAFAPFGISAIENPWSAILTVPLVSAIVETVIEAIVTPWSKKICEIIKSE